MAVSARPARPLRGRDYPTTFGEFHSWFAAASRSTPCGDTHGFALKHAFITVAFVSVPLGYSTLLR